MCKQELRRAYTGLLEGDAKKADPLIRFLEKDEYKFGTGYAKELIWRNLKRVKLTDNQKQRLRKVAMTYLNKRMQREFWYMCRFIHLIADDTFRSQVKTLTESKDGKVRQRASLLYAYLQSDAQGERVRRDFYYKCLRVRHRFGQQ